MAAKKILLVQLYSNGDCLYATAVARQIKQDFPGCYLVWAIASFCKSIIDGNPYIDEVIEVNAVSKDDVKAFRKYKKEISKRRNAGEFDEVFITQIADNNLAYYDGCIRSNIFRAYPFPVTVPVMPVLVLYDKEINNVKKFSLEHKLDQYQHVVLFEYAPQSGQLPISKEFAITVAEDIVKKNKAAVILSSAFPIEHPDKAIIDGSRLSLRETAALTHYCSLLVGCSSGISWISTSSAAMQLPMVQLVNPDAFWINPVSRDFERFHLPVTNIIDLVSFDRNRVARCISAALDNFNKARYAYNQDIPLKFGTTTRIVYNLLCYMNLSGVMTHIKTNRKVYGHNFFFYIAVLKGFWIFPFWLIRNTIKKRY